MILLLALFLITLKAFLDAYNHMSHTCVSEKQRKIADSIDLFYKVFIPVITFAWITIQPYVHVREDRFWVLIIGYALLWFGSFDYIYNAIRKDVPWDYIGWTKWWDRFLRSLKLHPTLLLFTRLIAFLWGSAWLLGWKDGIRLDWIW